MIKHLAVCGDSFGVGHGLPPERQFEDSFGGLVADHYKLKHLVYARSGCCNFVIYLQVKKIIDQQKLNPFFKPFVLISTTWSERITFPLWYPRFFGTPDLSEVDYLNYDPYNKNKPHWRKLPFRTNRKHRLVSENIPMNNGESGLEHLYENLKAEDHNAVTLYFNHLHDPYIKEMIDYSLMSTAHHLLIKHQIPHLFLSPKKIETVSSVNLLKHDWIEISNDYPDSVGSGHCNEQGHKITADSIIKHIEKENLLSKKIR